MSIFSACGPGAVPGVAETAQGKKVIEPGDIVAAAASQVGSQPVTVDGVNVTTPTDTGQAYHVYWNSTAGTMRRVSVPLLAGYTIGYTLSPYGTTSGHGPVPPPVIIPGNTATISDDAIAAETGGAHYADLWWYYTYTPSCSITVNCPVAVQAGGTPVTCTGTVSNLPTTGTIQAGSEKWSSSLALAGVTVNPGIVSPENKSTSTAVSAAVGAMGTATIRLDAAVEGGGPGAACWGSGNVAVLPPAINWFSSGNGGDVIAAGGGVTSEVVRPYFLNNNAVGTSGLAAADNGFFGVTAANVNAQTPPWWLDLTHSPAPWTAVLNRQENTYAYMKQRIMARVVSPYEITTAAVTGTTLAGVSPSAVNSISSATLPPVVVMHSAGPLGISGDLGGARVLLLVDGDVNISGKITLTANTGFLAIFASGNITVSPTVGSGSTTNVDITAADYAPHVTGVFYAGGAFNTGTTGATDSQLRIDGTVIGMNGVGLARNNMGNYPAEYFYFRPEFTLTLKEIGLRQRIVQELINP